MLARGRTKTGRALTRLVLILLFAFVLLMPSIPAGRAEIPSVQPHPDSSRTITWTMNDSAYLTPDNVTFAGGNASLPWTESVLSLPNGSAIAGESQGPLDANLSASSAQITLRQNWSSRLADGNFTSPGPWTFVNGTADNTTARWDAVAQGARLNHSSASTERMWDSMDVVPGNWSPLSGCYPASNGELFRVTGGSQKEGAAALGARINVSQGSGCYVGILNTSGFAIDWSRVNQLWVWLYLNRSAPAAFQISAFNNATQYLTFPAPLAPGWQDVPVDLTQLGPGRKALTTVTLRFLGTAGQSVTNVTVYVDAIRIGVAKVADTTARVSQAFDKPQTTSRVPGSAYLSFDWSLPDPQGVRAYAACATLSGPAGSTRRTLQASQSGAWSHFLSDVSANATAVGRYNLSFSLEVVLNDTASSSVVLLIDNASFVFPGTENGTYLSKLETMGSDSLYDTLSWVGSVASTETTLRVSIRTGNTSSIGDSTWSPWQGSSASPTNLAVPGALYFQLRADLGTTNASVAPFLAAITLQTEHRAAFASIRSFTFEADASLLSWRSFNASFDAPTGTSIAFEVGNGTFLTPVTPGSILIALQGLRVQWKATFSTSDGLLTPRLHSVSITYEYQGPPARVVLSARGSVLPAGATVNMSSGQYLLLSAQAYDAGSHLLPSSVAPLYWSIDDPKGGTVFPNGTYVAGRPGVYLISAVVVGTTVVASVRVNVSAVSGPFASPWSLGDAWPILVVLAAVGAAFLVYEVYVRRRFAIDDVFVIARDGRLMMHNTRRMRADRDEDVLSGMLTAVIAFLKDWDPEENGRAKRFDYGDKTALLEHGERVYVAAVYSGRVPRWASKDLARFVRDLEIHFGDAFVRWSGDPADLHGLREFVGRFVAHTRYHGNGRGNGRPEAKCG